MPSWQDHELGRSAESFCDPSSADLLNPSVNWSSTDLQLSPSGNTESQIPECACDHMIGRLVNGHPLPGPQQIPKCDWDQILGKPAESFQERVISRAAKSSVDRILGRFAHGHPSTRSSADLPHAPGSAPWGDRPMATRIKAVADRSANRPTIRCSDCCGTRPIGAANQVAGLRFQSAALNPSEAPAWAATDGGTTTPAARTSSRPVVADEPSPPP